ncbi:hypothetical protein [Natrialba sp. INN-245]|uniref:hypothetical protein n=1 Tax=Natrialba sp. INN-245 TaxID=2690967 RepID=UPI00130F9DC1|nr:hypothetical protein [Natrialba sp. INN-245]MWV39584.1 hypothetical protein [Natrialba sp. INN-245]
MPETEQQDKTLSELIVKEAVEKGLDTPLRDSILEAVDGADERPTGGPLSLVGAGFGLGATIGYLAGRYGPDLEEPSFEDIEEPEIIEDVVAESESPEEQIEIDEETESEGSSSRLPKLLLVLGAVAGIAILRRRLSESEDEEWEPIEEFEPATSVGTADESEADESDAESESETGTEGGDEGETEADADEE